MSSFLVLTHPFPPSLCHPLSAQTSTRWLTLSPTPTTTCWPTTLLTTSTPRCGAQPLRGWPWCILAFPIAFGHAAGGAAPPLPNAAWPSCPSPAACRTAWTLCIATRPSGRTCPSCPPPAPASSPPTAPSPRCAGSNDLPGSGPELPWLVALQPVLLKSVDGVTQVLCTTACTAASPAHQIKPTPPLPPLQYNRDIWKSEPCVVPTSNE